MCEPYFECNVFYAMSENCSWAGLRASCVHDVNVSYLTEVALKERNEPSVRIYEDVHEASLVATDMLACCCCMRDVLSPESCFQTDCLIFLESRLTVCIIK